MKYFDKKNNRLVWLSGIADEEFWDNTWSTFTDDLKKSSTTKDPWVIKNTYKYLSPPASILEGGCGVGHNVFHLNKLGYKVIGLDWAQDIVRNLKLIHPHLSIEKGDVRALNFDDDQFDGYWSLGVIEHFFDGYNDIIMEMKRVVKKNGYIFLTVPCFSPIRKLKAKMGLYKKLDEATDVQKKFYQFGIPEKEIIENFEKSGFSLVKKKKMQALKGLKDEVLILHNILQKLYDSKSRFSYLLGLIIEICFRNFTNHASFFVFQKK